MPALKKVNSLQELGNSLKAIFTKTISYLLLPINPRRGFTLIELLITISIIAIISAVGLVSYSQTQKIARDAKRKQDLRSVAVALELYHQKNKYYPRTGWLNSISNDPWIADSLTTPTPVPFDSKYISKLPEDPGGNAYQYTSGAWGTCSDGEFYILMAALENQSDPERWVLNQTAPCGVIPSTLSPAWDNFFVISQDK